MRTDKAVGVFGHGGPMASKILAASNNIFNIN